MERKSIGHYIVVRDRRKKSQRKRGLGTGRRPEDAYSDQRTHGEQREDDLQKAVSRDRNRGAYGVRRRIAALISWNEKRRDLIPLANSVKSFLAPEGRWKLAGGYASLHHRDGPKKIVRVPAGTPDRNSHQYQSRSGALSGRVVLLCRFRRRSEA